MRPWELESRPQRLTHTHPPRTPPQTPISPPATLASSAFKRLKLAHSSGYRAEHPMKRKRPGKHKGRYCRPEAYKSRLTRMDEHDLSNPMPTVDPEVHVRSGYKSPSPTKTFSIDHTIPFDFTNAGLDGFANSNPLFSVAAGTIPPPLPPSVEEAYRKKCIELKRRMTEVEESNDAFRVRKARLTRGIRKMRLERAYLLEILGKRMKKNGSSLDGFQGFYDEESEGSSEGPPTPHEKPLRSKRSHRRPVSSPPPILGHQHPRPIAPSQTHPTSAFEPSRDHFRESSYQQVPTTNGHSALHYPPHPSTFPPDPSNSHVHQVVSRPVPPIYAFNDFKEDFIKKGGQQRFPYRNDEELDQISLAAWNDRNLEEYKHFYEERFDKRWRVYMEQKNEYESMIARENGEINIEVRREVPPPLPPQAQGVAGGFTSING